MVYFLIMEMRKEPQPGEFYRHFKNRLYQVLSVAYDAETEAAFVVYQALYGDYRVWIRPLDNFMSEVDREKYPEVTQHWRFERVWPGSGSMGAEPGSERAGETVASPEDASLQQEAPSAFLLAFLDAKTAEEQRELLLAQLGSVTQRDLNSVCTACGISERAGDIESQARSIIRALALKARYESDRHRGRR